MSAAQYALAVLAGLTASECTELAPWLARRLVAWAAHHRYSDPDRARVRAEELQAVLLDRPTKVLKLFTATAFAATATVTLAGRAARGLAHAGHRVHPGRRVVRTFNAVRDLNTAAYVFIAGFVLGGVTFSAGVTISRLDIAVSVALGALSIVLCNGTIIVTTYLRGRGSHKSGATTGKR